MKLKYIVLLGDQFIRIYIHPKFGYVVVLPESIATHGDLIIRDNETDEDLEGDRFEEIKRMIMDSLPVFNQEPA